MKTIKEAFNAGRNCGMFGASTTNCHFSFFATEELTEAHSRGVREGKKITSDRFKE